MKPSNFGALHYLFVGKNQQDSIPQLILRQHPQELLPGLAASLSVVTVHDEDEACRKASLRHQHID